jgi:archaeal flagellar protein FlaF
MAVADLLGAVVGVLLLVIVAYMLVGSTLSTAEIVTNAQKSVALQEQTQVRTDFSIIEANKEDDSNFNCTINNTGKEIISDFRHMDVIVYDSSTRDYQVYTYNPDKDLVIPGTWKIVDQGTDIIHHSELDPGESYRILVTTSGISPYWFQITTGNGVYASKLL